MKKQIETSVRDELREIAPKLLAQKDLKRGFRIPDNYFETMQQEVLAKVASESLPTAPAQIRTLFWVRAAAILLIVATALWMIFSIKQPDTSEQMLADAIDAYVMDNVEVFDLETILEVSDHLDETEYPLPDDLTDEELNQFLDEYFDEFDLAILESYF